MFNKKRQPEKNCRLKHFKAIKLIFIAIFNFLACFFILFNQKKIKKYIKGQKKEINELRTGKENLPRFIKDSKALLKDFFIPCVQNCNRPKILRPRALISYALIIISVKIIVSGFLFFNYPTPAELSAIISSNVINLVNNSRTEAGIEPLIENKDLTDFAYNKAQDMIDRGYFAHDTPEGKRPWQWIDRSVYDYVYAGENLAMDFITAETLHNAFLKSPSHKKNILNQKYKEIGVAVVNGELNGKKTILLVQFFGTQRKDFSSLAAGVYEKQNFNDQIVQETEKPTSSPVVAGQQHSEWQPSSDGIIVVSSSKNSGKSALNLIIEYSNIFFLAFLMFITLSLLLNILVKIKVQDASVILQSLALIALALAMISINFHFIEEIAPNILIL